MKPERNHGVLLRLAYEGTEFSGWAIQQKPVVRTVEGVLRGAIIAIDREASEPRGASRTDAGVHADGQLVAFDSTKLVDPRGWVMGINRHLPDDVAVQYAVPVAVDYSPRRASIWKRYRYTILQSRVRSPTWRAFAWRVGHSLDLDRMRREASLFVGSHDFRAFRSRYDSRDETRRTLYEVDVKPRDGGRLEVHVRGSAFMHNMVRIIVGTLVDVARGALEEGAATRALDSGSRDHAGMTAPAHGLCLEHIELGSNPELGDGWPD